MNQIFYNSVAETTYFDGKIVSTLKTDKLESTSYKRNVKKEHISLAEPGSQYAGLFIPQTGNAISISTALNFFFQK